MTHTPGPWVVKEVFGLPDEEFTAIMAFSDKEEVCILPNFRKANARLIAAVPALLEALEMVVADHDELSPALVGMPLNVANSTIDKARAAIAQAKGE